MQLFKAFEKSVVLTRNTWTFNSNVVLRLSSSLITSEKILFNKKRIHFDEIDDQPKKTMFNETFNLIHKKTLEVETDIESDINKDNLKKTFTISEQLVNASHKKYETYLKSLVVDATKDMTMISTEKPYNSLISYLKTSVTFERYTFQKLFNNFIETLQAEVDYSKKVELLRSILYHLRTIEKKLDKVDKQMVVGVMVNVIYSASEVLGKNKEEYPDEHAIRLLLNLVNGRGDYGGALSLYFTLKNEFNFKTSVGIKLQLMKANSYEHKYENTLRLFYNTMHEYSKETVKIKEEESNALTYDMYKVFRLALTACSKSQQRAPEGEKVFDLMKRRGFRPCQKCVGALLTCYARVGDIESSIRLLDLQRDKDKTIVMYTVILTAITTNQAKLSKKHKTSYKSNKVFNEIAEILDIDVTPTESSHQSSYKLATEQNYKFVNNLIAQMYKARVKPNTYFATNLAKFYVVANDSKNLGKVIKKNMDFTLEDPSLFFKLFDMYLLKKNYKSCNDVAKEVLENFTINQLTAHQVGTFAQFYALQKTEASLIRAFEILSLFVDNESKKDKLSEQHYNNIKDAYNRSTLSLYEARFLDLARPVRD